jgi:hypothetical protein
MNRQNLIDAGYKIYEDRIKEESDGLYQKRIGQTRYFIHIYEYDLTKYGLVSLSYECDLNFELKENDYINIKFSCSKMTIDELEQRVNWIFEKLECIDYE